MPTPLHSGGRRRALVATAATALLAALGLVLILVGLIGPSGPPAPSATAPRPPATVADAPRAATTPEPAERDADTSTGHQAAADSGRSPDFGPVLPGSPPVRLDIPRIDVHSSDIVGLGYQKDGSIEVPKDPASPGWFTPGPSPGQYGPAIIAGHVDSSTGPAVFYRLGELRSGDRITVTRKNGTVATFVVDRVEAVEKDAFPTREVYGATDRAELRLITCSGEFDQQDGYLGNTIVFAHLT
jgi:LPXTG-site transpeptidase (sortase) family protein